MITLYVPEGASALTTEIRTILKRAAAAGSHHFLMRMNDDATRVRSRKPLVTVIRADVALIPDRLAGATTFTLGIIPELELGVVPELSLKTGQDAGTRFLTPFTFTGVSAPKLGIFDAIDAPPLTPNEHKTGACLPQHIGAAKQIWGSAVRTVTRNFDNLRTVLQERVPSKLGLRPFDSICAPLNFRAAMAAHGFHCAHEFPENRVMVALPRQWRPSRLDYGQEMMMRHIFAGFAESLPPKDVQRSLWSRPALGQG